MPKNDQSIPFTDEELKDIGINGNFSYHRALTGMQTKRTEKCEFVKDYLKFTLFKLTFNSGRCQYYESLSKPYPHSTNSGISQPKFPPTAKEIKDFIE